MMSPKFLEYGFARWFAFSYQLSAGRHVPLRADDLAKGVRRLNFKFSKHALEEQGQEILERAMKVKYHQDVDVLDIRFSDAPVDESDEEKPGIILDYDKDGDIVGIES